MSDRRSTARFYGFFKFLVPKKCPDLKNDGFRRWKAPEKQKKPSRASRKPEQPIQPTRISKSGLNPSGGDNNDGLKGYSPKACRRDKKNRSLA
ncbi:MAG: hypothetical protein V4726_21260 [Verrucomicrobiota bacterium]